jgi:hypothetical protein
MRRKIRPDIVIFISLASMFVTILCAALSLKIRNDQMRAYQQIQQQALQASHLQRQAALQAIKEAKNRSTSPPP